MAQYKPMQLEIFQDAYKAKKPKNTYSGAVDDAPEFKFPTQLCVRAACLLIVVLVSFALGVERGKLLTKKKISTRVLAEGKSEEIIKEIVIKEEVEKTEVKVQKEEPPVADKKLEIEEKDDTIVTSGYMIQVASYKKNSSFIDRELANLEKSGYNTHTVSGNNYMGICARFNDKREAQKHLKILQKTYKDCFIKKI